jgi:hypothetical protein
MPGRRHPSGWHLLKTRTELTAEAATAVGELVEQIREIVRW